MLLQEGVPGDESWILPVVDKGIIDIVKDEDRESICGSGSLLCEYK